MDKPATPTTYLLPAECLIVVGDTTVFLGSVLVLVNGTQARADEKGIILLNVVTRTS